MTIIKNQEGEPTWWSITLAVLLWLAFVLFYVIGIQTGHGGVFN